MTQPSSLPLKKSSMQTVNDDEIDLISLMLTLWDKKLFICLITFLFTLFGVSYALLATPIYRANAIVQVEEKSPGLPGLSEVSEIFGTESAAVTEIELLKSRKVIGEAVEKERLDIIVQPLYLPVVGKGLARLYSANSGLVRIATDKSDSAGSDQVAPPIFGLSRFSTGGEEIEVPVFSVPPARYGESYTLIAGKNDQFFVVDSDNTTIFSGKVGVEYERAGHRIYVAKLRANPGAEFLLQKLRPLSAIIKYQKLLAASEKGKDSGIISLAIEDENPKRAEDILNVIARAYLRQNVERQSAEAAKSLEFLRQQLPQIKADLENAEKNLNAYQVKAGSVNISAEAEVLLEQIVDIESGMGELQLQQAELDRKYTRDHPAYQAWREQMAEQKARKRELNERVKGLPGTQQELLALKRDLEVGTAIYTQMLNNIQELDIVRAGTVGNVRIVDPAAVDVEEPVKPKKALIVIIATLLGGFVSVAIVLIRSALNRGIESPEELESIGLPVYASIPLSDEQTKLDRSHSKQTKVRRQKAKKGTHPTSLLAQENPTDIAVESLRSLRTSLHFAMLEAKNNIIMITGPSPTVGKSFVSGNLAAVIAQSGQKVLLIDADMRKGYIHKMFSLKQKEGLSDILGGRAEIEDTISPTSVGNLLVLPRGTVPPNPSELLMTKGMTDVLDYASKNFDLVIVDTPPVLAVTDAAIIGPQCGVALLVTRYDFNPLREIELTKKRFEQNGTPIKGAVLNAIQRKAGGYGYGYGYYNYHYEYKSETPS